MYTIEKIKRQQYHVGSKCFVMMDGSELGITITHFGDPDSAGLRLVKIMVTRSAGKFSSLVFTRLEGFCRDDFENWNMAPLGQTAETIGNHYLTAV